MSEPASPVSITAVAPPRWHMLVLLIFFPAAYWLNGGMVWSYLFFIRRDHSYFMAFGAAVCLLHWASVVFALWSLRRIGARLSDIGLNFSLRKAAWLLATVVLLGAVLIAARQRWPIHETPPEDYRFFYPFTLAERCFFVFMALSAGICEEIVYRGYAITALQGRGWRAWQAVVLAAFAFVFMHGLATFFLFPFLIVVGLVYGCLFLWCKSLTPLIWLHCLFDLMAVVAI